MRNVNNFLCLQEELKILRLKNSLLMEEELANFSKELLFDIDHKKLLKVSTCICQTMLQKKLKAF